MAKWALFTAALVLTSAKLKDAILKHAIYTMDFIYTMVYIYHHSQAYLLLTFAYSSGLVPYFTNLMLSSCS